MNFRISGQKIIPTTHTKYLGILMDQHLLFLGPTPKNAKAIGLMDF